MSSKMWFYARGQIARARGWSRGKAEEYHRIDVAADFARIAFDAGFRGLSL